ncbi:hypothetical protein EVAR_58827_1 [Eumeta japonica]|uniref:Uncharacterized protein n=1 Tax=Eumeta variegata TaxID=151549 RepID=A0A4C1YL74_EUMVA|nr:hypothetical protein EVAR_58827_1 [Eumeta japonica]
MSYAPVRYISEIQQSDAKSRGQGEVSYIRKDDHDDGGCVDTTKTLLKFRGPPENTKGQRCDRAYGVFQSSPIGHFIFRWLLSEGDSRGYAANSVREFKNLQLIFRLLTTFPRRLFLVSITFYAVPFPFAMRFV